MPELAVPLRGRSDHDPDLNEHVSRPSAGQAPPSIFRDTFYPAKHSIWCIRSLSKTHFVRDFPQEVKVEETELSCETSLKSQSGKCENEVFVLDLARNLTVEDVKTELSCQTS